MCTMLIFQANSWDLFKPWDIAPCHCKLVSFLFYHVVIFSNNVTELKQFQNICLMAGTSLYILSMVKSVLFKNTVAQSSVLSKS